MWTRYKDLTGKRYGALTVLKYLGNINPKRNTAYFLCRCDCGKEKAIEGTSLSGGKTKSCGCRINIVENFIGKRFGRLVVIEETEPRITPSGSKERRYLCQCDCGNTKNISRAGLQGGTKSCGCLGVEICKNIKNKNVFQATHGKRHTRLYHIWLCMKQKCSNPKNPEFKRYGKRGITVCAEWKNDFQCFWDWSYANGYKEEIMPNGKNKWTIDRIDTNGNYEPSNCRWVDMLIQSNNKRDNHLITYEGETLTLAQTARKYGINRQLLSERLCYGWSIDEAIKTPVSPQRHKQRKPIEQDGRRKENKRLENT